MDVLEKEKRRLIELVVEMEELRKVDREDIEAVKKVLGNLIEFLGVSVDEEVVEGEVDETDVNEVNKDEDDVEEDGLGEVDNHVADTDDVE